MYSTAGPGTTRSAIVASENSRSAWADGMSRTLPARPHGGNATARPQRLRHPGDVPAEVVAAIAYGARRDHGRSDPHLTREAPGTTNGERTARGRCAPRRERRISRRAP